MNDRVYCNFLGVGSIAFFFFLFFLFYLVHGLRLHSFQMFIFILLSLISHHDLFPFVFACQLLIYDVNRRLIDFVALTTGLFVIWNYGD
ncbi:hypothetical protein L873DRAFT_1856719 [Choiromyces venosus 120613-1]|uniref:Uncharacterized protein n=1 Tax=Choiromyces venosus 120613-1 TaxID=1336337 RepID=A0A3N4K2T1_9PEZI|nr:hypothetical protein L873DRAFT_1856719 [Choiromyces venosus 120613-1]